MKSFGLALVILIFEVCCFTYEVNGLDESCRELYTPVGCFKDQRNNHAMPYLLLTDRDATAAAGVYSGREIDWGNFPVYLESLACRCARKTKEAGHTYFGLQFYGECWSSEDAEFDYDYYGESAQCANGVYGKCEEPNAGECVGRANANFVYKLTEEGNGSGEVPPLNDVEVL